MHFSKNKFIPNKKYISPKKKMYLSKKVFVQIKSVFFQIKNIFFQIVHAMTLKENPATWAKPLQVKGICKNFKMQTASVQISKCISPN